MLRRAGFIVLCVALISACSRGSSQPLTATGRGTTRALDGSIAVPDVACRTLDKAKASIKDVGLKAKAHDATGDGRMQIVDSNWVVLSQTPAAGVAATAGETVGLEVAKEGERPCPAGTSSSSTTVASPTSEPSSTTTLPPTTPPPTTTLPPTTLPPTTTPERPSTTPQPTAASAYYANCAQARAAGAAPLYRGQPGYRPELDRDGDGVACEK